MINKRLKDFGHLVVIVLGLLSIVSSGGGCSSSGGSGSATCDGSHLNLCTASGTCTGAGGYWYNNTCNSSLKPIERVSVDSSGTEGNDRSEIPSISSDGRYVAFTSGADNLVAGDMNNTWDVFVRDTQTGTTTRVSVDNSGTEGNDDSDIPSISSDGRYVAFRSYAYNLVAGDTNNASDVFVHDRQTGTTTRVSVDSSGTEGNGDSGSPSISSDGRYVAFYSLANNLVAGDTNSYYDVFVHDMQTGTTTRVSVDSSGTEGKNGESFHPSISSDGRYVAFVSRADNLVAGDTNNTADIFVHDTQTGTTTRVSVDSSVAEGNGDSGDPSISSDGRYVAFTSRADNLVAGDTNYTWDVFVHDMQTGTTTRISVNSSGTQGNDISINSSLSSDGRYVAFYSFADNLVAGDTNQYYDVFVHDTQTGTTTRVSVDSSGTEGNNNSWIPVISSDGSYVAFDSFANNLVAGDTNNTQDVFRAPNR
jgi:Tol biopolymer transport system component